MFHINDIKKQENGILFDQQLDIFSSISEREPSILALDDVHAVGTISYESGLYRLTYQLTYRLTMPSSRSAKPVVLNEVYDISEVFGNLDSGLITPEVIEEEFVIPIEGDTISLDESVIDNIILNVPSRVLSPDETDSDELPSGDSWTVLTQEQFEQLKLEKERENSPFAALENLFDEE